MHDSIELDEVECDALRALDGMLEITHNEMLVRGKYISEGIVDEELAEQGAICGGRQACAVGALWLGAGISIQYHELPGTDQREREEFFENRPALKMAYDAMNTACQVYIVREGINDGLALDFWAPMERLFEGSQYGAPLVDAYEVFPALIRQAADLIIRRRRLFDHYAESWDDYIASVPDWQFRTLPGEES